MANDPWAKLRAFTRARIGLDRCGDGMSTAALLQFQLDHAHARDAVKRSADFDAMAAQLGRYEIIRVQSAAMDRATYIRRPDLGRRLHESSRALLAARRTAGPPEVVFVIADGLSSAAVEHHASATLQACLRQLEGWRVAPIVLASQARVALGDEIAVLLHADLCVVLIGERPGLSVADSLGIYITWRPRVGHRDADRNCLSNVHCDGLSYEQAAGKVCWLLCEARRRKLTGTTLKEEAGPQPAALTGAPEPLREFEGNLVSKGPGGAWTFLAIPFSVEKEFGKKSRVAVSGTINGFAFRNSLMPEGDGTHSMMVGKELQAGANVMPGDRVRVALRLDASERRVEVPIELEQAFSKDKAAKAAFEALAYSRKKEYAEWVRAAKKPQTKAARVQQALGLLTTGVKRLR